MGLGDSGLPELVSSEVPGKLFGVRSQFERCQRWSVARPMFLSWIYFLQKPPASQISTLGACDKESKVPQEERKREWRVLCKWTAKTLLCLSKGCCDENFPVSVMSENLSRTRQRPDPWDEDGTSCYRLFSAPHTLAALTQ